jgi:hypothetical protein
MAEDKVYKYTMACNLKLFLTVMLCCEIWRDKLSKEANTFFKLNSQFQYFFSIDINGGWLTFGVNLQSLNMVIGF